MTEQQGQQSAQQASRALGIRRLGAHPRETWDRAERGVDLLIVAGYLGVDRRLLARAAARCLALVVDCLLVDEATCQAAVDAVTAWADHPSAETLAAVREARAALWPVVHVVREQAPGRWLPAPFDGLAARDACAAVDTLCAVVLDDARPGVAVDEAGGALQPSPREDYEWRCAQIIRDAIPWSEIERAIHDRKPATAARRNPATTAQVDRRTSR